jgi:hypothetical protein
MTTQPLETLLTPNPSLYEQDYYLWLQTTVNQLRERKFAEVDLANLIEEIESMGRSEKSALGSNLQIVLMHLLKYKYQPEIGQIYPTLTLEQIHATILYYLHEKERVSQYRADWLKHCQKGEQEQERNPPAFVEKMRKFKAERAAEAQNIKKTSLIGD